MCVSVCRTLHNKAGSGKLQAAASTRIRNQVRERVNELGSFTKWRLQREIEQKYPALGYPIFMRDGLTAVWKMKW
jgi:hypothetical protein